jgi:hypothetical protein
MQKQLIFRVKALEQRLPEDKGVTKKVLPEWLVEELRNQGIRCTLSGMPDWSSLSAARASV